MIYVIVHQHSDPHSKYGLMSIGSVYGPFPNANAAMEVAKTMGGIVAGYYVRPVHEAPK